MKNLFTLTLLVFLPILLAAQSGIGFKGGINFSNHALSDQQKDLWNANLTPGFQAGAFYDLSFGGMFGLEIGGIFSRRGTARETKVPVFSENFITSTNAQGVTTVSDFTGNIDYKEQISYLDFPVMFKFNLRGRGISPYFMAGPQLSFAMGANRKDIFYQGNLDNYLFDGTNYTFINTTAVDDASANAELEIGSGRNDQIRPTDFGIAIGAGLSVELDFGYIVADVRYFMGMSNIVNSSNPIFDTKNRSIMINVGYMYPIGGW